ncbi:DNA-3-methyladenine glycosylase family protein [Halobacillus campisalis]|uniref:DNA-3-methyladenine glycosylase II n=1 Tax=Halobacillus campisalis TaxID=435909 RepID=A0ABW2K9V6_9BACI|nr:DNA-3-methyladenine glycosylase [Halobacillus campisalis]
MWKKQVESIPGYDFDYSLARWAFDPLTKLSREERWIEIPVKLTNGSHVVRIQALGTTKHPLFEVSSEDEKSKEDLLEYIYSIFQWDRDLNEVYEHFQNTNLAELFTNHFGTPIVKDFHLYDCLMKVIIHQQLNMKFAYTLSTRFVEQFGYCYKGVWFYPSPKRVSELSYDQLRELQFSQRKAEYIIDTSKLIASGELDLERLASLPDEDVIKQLTRVRGIGPWTAENWLMFGVGREDLFPKADIGIQNAMKHYFHLESKPDHQKMIQLSKGWHPFRSYASLTLWRSIDSI